MFVSALEGVALCLSGSFLRLPSGRGCVLKGIDNCLNCEFLNFIYRPSFVEMMNFVTFAIEIKTTINKNIWHKLVGESLRLSVL